MTNKKLNNADREQWIMNDEGLYNWYRGGWQSMREFIRQNKTDIDVVILAILNMEPAAKTWRDY